MPNLKKSESIIFHCMGITFPSTVCIYYSMFSYAGWCEAGCFSVIFTNSYFFPCIFFYSSIFFGSGNSYIRESLLISVAEVNVDALKAFKAGFARVYFQEQEHVSTKEHPLWGGLYFETRSGTEKRWWCRVVFQ